MTNRLEVSFNSPQCGWMSIGFAGETEEFHTTTAHAPHERALPELLKILTALLDKNSGQDEFTLAWNRNPEEFDFRFLRENNDLLLEIYQYPSDSRAGAERELVFAHRGDVRQICRAFYDTFEQLHADKDTDEFEFNWRQAFPLREYEELARALKSSIESPIRAA